MLTKDGYRDAKTLREIRLKTGLVFQNFNLFPHFSVLRNITEAPVRVLKRGKAEAKQNAMELLKKMGLETKAGLLSLRAFGRTAAARFYRARTHA